MDMLPVLLPVDCEGRRLDADAGFGLELRLLRLRGEQIAEELMRAARLPIRAGPTSM